MRILLVIATMSMANYAVCQDEVRRAEGSTTTVTTSRSLVLNLFEVIGHKEHLKESGGKNFELFDRTQIWPAIEKLESVAVTRIPSSASEPQRAKLKLAASIDIRRTIAELRAFYANGSMVSERLRGRDLDIFGSGSLFEKVLRQQGLLKN